jgi:hypothetical protein
MAEPWSPSPGHPGITADEVPDSLHTALNHAAIAKKWQERCEGMSTEIGAPSSDHGGRKIKWKAEVGPTDGVGSFLCGFIYYTSLTHYFLSKRVLKDDNMLDLTTPDEAKSRSKQKGAGGPVLFMHTPECPTEAHVKLGHNILVNLIHTMVESHLEQI